MRDEAGLPIEHWTVDFGYDSPPEPVKLPHAWRQDIPLSSEGPVTYRTSLEVPKTNSKLRFQGVGYHATVRIDGQQAVTHAGIWDAFEVPLALHSGTRIDIEVEVTKNGGPTYPVPTVASGFLPYLFHTFGGIYGEVTLLPADKPLTHPAPTTGRFHTAGSKIWVEGKPFYPRGLLHWGWYPDLGHTNPPAETIRKEVTAAKSLGFNLVKFCQWVPSHRYLEILHEENLEAWLDLPVWQPSADPKDQEQIANEIEQIVRQYRHHPNIMAWTIGTDLGAAIPPDFQARLTSIVKNLTSSPLVNTGTSDFQDLHPFAETHFYPQLLDSLAPPNTPGHVLLLGEYNDANVHRDLAGLANEIPYWASNLSELNERGLRLQYELPEILTESRFANYPTREKHRHLMESSRTQALFMRKSATEAVRSREAFSGYVIAGWRDTPITSSGFFDDWDKPRFTQQECESWNGPTCLFLIPNRSTPWIHGGNRPEYADGFNHFTGLIQWNIGIHSELPLTSGLLWQIRNAEGTVVTRGTGEYTRAQPLKPRQIGQIQWFCQEPGDYTLEVEFAQAKNAWPISVTTPFATEDQNQWRTDDPTDSLGFQSQEGALLLTTRLTDTLQPGLVILTGEGTLPRPFWREATYENPLPWCRMLPIAPDRVLTATPQNSQTIVNRIDTRTYQEHPILIRSGDTFITTLRLFGGLGNQPNGIPKNPSGLALLRLLAQTLNPNIG